MNKQYRIKLTRSVHNKLMGLTRKGAQKARKLRRVRILLLSNEGKTDLEITRILKISPGTVFNTRRRYCLEGLESTLNEKSRPGAPKKYDGLDKAKITALACSTPPEGRSQWSLRLLADKAVKLELVDSISHTSVEQILKKTN
jgi:transposase